MKSTASEPGLSNRDAGATLKPGAIRKSERYYEETMQIRKCM